MNIEFIILLVVVVVGFALVILLTRRRESVSSGLLKEYDERIQERVENKIKLAEKDLESKKDLILQTVDQIKQQLNETQKTGVTIKTVIKEHKETTEKLNTTTADLKNLLSNNQLRGAWGEKVAEDLLRLAGFQKGMSYVTQKQQDTESSIPDITVFLPNKTKLHIDVKFPFRALQQYQESGDKQYIAQFKKDVKNKIKQITSRNYINPEENTVDFVIMFIPNEMIFSFIYEQFPDVWDEAIKKKVVMAGPFSFTAILRMVQQAYDNFKYQKNIHEIVAHIKTFEQEYVKFSDAVNTLGSRLESTTKAFSEVAITRDKKLSGIVERIKMDENLLVEAGEEHEERQAK